MTARHPPRRRTPESADRGPKTGLRATVRGPLVAGFLAFLAGLYALVPPSPDQFELTYVAWRLNHGAAPYAGVIDMNWPGAFWLHQLIAWLPQGPVYPWRLLDFGIMLAGVAATARWIRPVFGPAAAAAVLIGYPLLYGDPRAYWFAGQRDAVCFHLVLLAAACHGASLRRMGWRTAVATGALVAAATLVKPVAIVAAPALLVHGLLRPGPSADKAKRLGWNVAGGLAALAAAGAALALQGAPWRETVDAAWIYNLTGQHNTKLPLTRLSAIAFGFGLDAWKLLAVAAVIGLGWTTLRAARRSEPADAARLAWCLLPAALAFYALQNKGFLYHLAWLQGLAHLVALATAGVAASVAARGFARGRMAVPRWKSIASALVFLCVLGTVLVKAAAYRAPLAVLAGTLPRAEFLDRQLAGPGTSVAEAESIAAELRGSLPEGADPEDHPVLVFGDAVSINLLSGRPLPTAFYYPRVLTAMHTGGSAMAQRWDARFAAELSASTPPVVYIGESVRDQARAAGVPAAAVLDAWLAERYRPAGRVGGLLRYQRQRISPDPRTVDQPT